MEKWRELLDLDMFWYFHEMQRNRKIVELLPVNIEIGERSRVKF